MSTWLIIATTDDDNYAAQTTVSDQQLIYRAASKWLIRGGASKILSPFWSHIDQWDNELEDALLDQLNTQARTKPKNPQITNVRTRDYSIDMTVHSEQSVDDYITCTIDFTLYVYFDGPKKSLKLDTQTIHLSMFKLSGQMEKIVVESSTKTPAPQSFLKGKRRTSKRTKKSDR